MSYRTALRRPNTAAPTDGSRTITITPTPAGEDNGSSSNDPEDSSTGVLRLRAASNSTRRPKQRVVWREDVVDNEGVGKKSSKICCIYHKPKAYDESSDEDDSDSDSDSDSSCDHDHPHGHNGHAHGHREGLQNRDDGASIEHIEHSEPQRNAYEIAPVSKKGKRKAT
ncbi:hypothetical protein GYMLUDRAFT_49813 [Collybiopsis luxurians FD-317 M1]|uniref:Type 1 phosphatases regulator n=1 Tax=Collybiopsis luxurians FD-317 M1 TaxID=944289 RepID=A0A0D0BDN9_9AGAR|nr:hypothetical protein GYMLUDRAFT_49813 [Collybiopsis luxurians FD-317 M1]